MKRFVLLLILPVLLLLSSCRKEEPVNRTGITVTVQESACYTVLNNGMVVLPGDSVTFVICPVKGYSITGADYPGAFTLRYSEEGFFLLTLTDVQYPVKVGLEISNQVRAILYDANGGSFRENDADLHYIQKTPTGYQFLYSIKEQLRPNTERGTDLFTRDGYTLYAWNTQPDGSGRRIGLGSRVTVRRFQVTLYAQWAKWAPETDFTYTVHWGDEGRYVKITGYSGNAETLVIPERIDGIPVKEIAASSFKDCKAETVILPKGLNHVRGQAFYRAALRDLVLFDDIVSIPDNAFLGCRNLTTLYVNVVEQHYGYYYRRESLLANKADLLINNHGKQKIVFYAGCSMWYNLDGPAMQKAVGNDYKVINMGLNGVSSSIVQMEILIPYLEEGDIFFHTPEISSEQQFLLTRDMGSLDEKLWAGLEYNYDLFRNVDINGMGGVFDSLTLYLGLKKDVEPPYRTHFVDAEGRTEYMDETGSIYFYRNNSTVDRTDEVDLNVRWFGVADLRYLEEQYNRINAKGVRIYISCAVLNIDAVPPEHREYLTEINDLFRIRMLDLPAVSAVISDMKDYVYFSSDMYDTNYHMSTVTQRLNTKTWIRDLLRQMRKDGLR